MSSTEDSKNRKVHDSLPCILVCYYIFLQLCKLAVPYFCSPHGNFWAGDARLGLFAGWCWCWFGLVGAGFLWEKNTVGWLVWAGWNQQGNMLKEYRCVWQRWVVNGLNNQGYFTAPSILKYKILKHLNFVPRHLMWINSTNDIQFDGNPTMLLLGREHELWV